MQLSVIPHLTIYGDVKESDIKKGGVIREKLERLGIAAKKKHVESKELTTEFKLDLMKVEVRADLMKASGQVGLNKPYRAPIYRNYLECIQGLYKQGLLGFYKGNGVRCAHVLLYQAFRNDMQRQLDWGNNIFKRNSFWRDFAAASLAGIFLHPLHLVEARLVLQNRIPNFSTYKSIWSLFMSSYREMLKGVTAHIPRSFLISLSKL
jgi:hypothetical protein